LCKGMHSVSCAFSVYVRLPFACKRFAKFCKESLVGRVKHVFVWSSLHVPGKEGIQEKRPLLCVLFCVVWRTWLLVREQCAMRRNQTNGISCFAIIVFQWHWRSSLMWT
jgi:hypothetical protein